MFVIFKKYFCNIKYVLLAFFYSFLQICLVIVIFIKYNSETFIKFFHSFKFVIFVFSNVLLYFSLNCFSSPLSHILSFVGLSAVQTFWQCFPFLQKSFLISISFFFQLMQRTLLMLIHSVVLYQSLYQ